MTDSHPHSTPHSTYHHLSFSLPLSLSLSLHLLISLQNLLEELHRLCQLMTSPFDLSHLILVGHTHPDPLVRLAAANCGYTVTQPSLCFSPSLPTTSCSPFGMSPASYSVTRFREDLTSIYTEAGMKVHSHTSSAICGDHMTVT